MRKYLDLKLGYSCNNDCLHCVISDQRDRALNKRGDINRSTQECKNEIIESKKKGCMAVTITGGEPTIRSDFLEVAEFAKDEGFEVLLQSNGSLFKNEDFAKKSCEFIDFFMIALHSNLKSVHDRITQREGSFEQTVLGLKNLLACRGDVGVKIVISKFNMATLLDTVKFVKDIGVEYVNIAFPHANGNAKKNFNIIVPDYSDIRDEIESIIEWAENEKFKVDFEEILPCALSKDFPLKYFADLKVVRGNGEVKQLDEDTLKWNDARVSMKRKGLICIKCVLNRFCEGYWREYVEIRGFDEFRSIRKMPVEVREFFKNEIDSWRR